MLVPLKEIWNTPRIRAEANSIEENLLKTTQKLLNLERQYKLKKMEFKTTQKLMNLERQYKLKKMELLVRIEIYEERLKWVSTELE